jgi:hypothetical protein
MEPRITQNQRDFFRGHADGVKQANLNGLELADIDLDLLFGNSDYRAGNKTGFQAFKRSLL